MNKIIVTGANGFIGSSLCNYLYSSNFDVRGTLRSLENVKSSNNIKFDVIGDMKSNIDWRDILNKCDVVIHCAGMNNQKNTITDISEYLKINVESTINLANQSIEAGVKRLIYLSSIKVNGEGVDDLKYTKIINHYDPPNPLDPYAKSKFEAEKALLNITAKKSLDLVILRLPIVYGYGVKNNFNRLLNLIKSGVPLPFASIINKRSMLNIENLLNLIKICIDHPNAPGKILLASDGQDLSTPELLKYIATAMDKPLRIFPFPPSLLKTIGIMLGKKNDMQKLLCTLQIDSSYTRKLLKWNPPVSVSDGIRSMVTGK